MSEQPEPAENGGSSKNLLILLALGLFIFVLWSLGQSEQASGKSLRITEFWSQLRNNEIAAISVDTNDYKAKVTYVDPNRKKRHVYLNRDVFRDLVQEVQRLSTPQDLKEGEQPITTSIETEKSSDLLSNALIQIAVVAGFFLLFWILILRRMGGGPGVFNFGKSRANLAAKEKLKVTFRDVAGIDEAVEEVKELVAFLKDPERMRRLGARIPRGFLLVGPPGCGKTLLAKAIAGEADVPFFSISGSDFVEMFVGVGASRVRDMFEQAKSQAPCILFLDEIDAVGRHRGTGLGGGHDEREQTLNQILVEMDGFDSDDNVIVIAASNRPDILDPALLRPGRFDRRITIDPPDVKGREEILKIHARKIVVAKDVKFHRIARATPGFTGAELETIVNEAALRAAVAGKDAVETEDFEEARDQLKWGRRRSGRQRHIDDLKAIAYHEAGHALANILLEGETEPLHKVTITPRGKSGGATMALPERDKYGYQREELLAHLSFLYGGRVGESYHTGSLSTGAQQDIEQATRIIRKMVTEWGMSERLGPLSYEEDKETLFLGREVSKTQHLSEETQREIDAEMRRIANEALDRTETLIAQNEAALRALAEELIEVETLTEKQVREIMREAGSNVELKTDFERSVEAGESDEKAEEEPADQTPEETQEAEASESSGESDEKTEEEPADQTPEETQEAEASESSGESDEKTEEEPADQTPEETQEEEASEPLESSEEADETAEASAKKA